MTAVAAVNLAGGTRKDSGELLKTSIDCTVVPTPQQLDTAQYIADMILELRNMARAVKLFAVMVPLEYAYYEAFSMANRVAVPSAEIARLHELAAGAKLTEDGATEDY